VRVEQEQAEWLIEHRKAEAARQRDRAREIERGVQSRTLAGLQVHVSDLGREAQQQASWRNHVKSSLWHEQTSRIIAELGEMINPKPPAPEPEEILQAVNEGADGLRGDG
jgi:hypothetical protein